MGIVQDELNIPIKLCAASAAGFFSMSALPVMAEAPSTIILSCRMGSCGVMEGKIVSAEKHDGGGADGRIVTVAGRFGYADYPGDNYPKTYDGAAISWDTDVSEFGFFCSKSLPMMQSGKEWSVLPLDESAGVYLTSNALYLFACHPEVRNQPATEKIFTDLGYGHASYKSYKSFEAAIASLNGTKKNPTARKGFDLLNNAERMTLQRMAWVAGNTEIDVDGAYGPKTSDGLNTLKTLFQNDVETGMSSPEAYAKSLRAYIQRGLPAVSAAGKTGIFGGRWNCGGSDLEIGDEKVTMWGNSSAYGIFLNDQDIAMVGLTDGYRFNLFIENHTQPNKAVWMSFETGDSFDCERIGPSPTEAPTTPALPSAQAPAALTAQPHDTEGDGPTE